MTSHARHLSRAGLGFSAPALLLILLLVLGPLFVVLGMSFTDYQLAAERSSFVGLANYLRIPQDAQAARALWNTLAYAAMVVPFSVGSGLFLALLVHRRRRTRRFYEIVFFLPVTSTLVAMAVVWQYLLHGRIGPINAVLAALDQSRIDFLTSPHAALASLAAIGVWKLAGFNMVLFLAGLTAIPEDVRQAAALDGADGPIDSFLRITWPLLAPTTLFVVVTTTIAAFQVFDTVAVLTKGGPGGATEVLVHEIYVRGFQSLDVGFASALVVVFVVLVCVLSLLQLALADRRVHYGA